MKNTLSIVQLGVVFLALFAMALVAFAGITSAQVATTTSSSGSASSTATGIKPTCTVIASPTQVIPGGASTITWVSSSDVSSLTFNNNINIVSPLSGSLMVSPTETTTYTGTARNAGDTSTCSVTVTVMPTSATTSTMATSTPTAMSPTTSPVTSSTSFNGSNIVDINANGSKPSKPVTTSGTTTIAPTTISTPTSGTTATLPTMLSYPTVGSTPAPMIVTIGASGDATIRGIVLASASDGIVIQAWGGWWFIHAASARFASNANDLASIKVGDFVGVQGNLMSGKPYTIHADFIRDWTTNPYVASSRVSTSEAAANSSTGTSTSQ